MLGELEDRVVSYLQKGTTSEGELLESVAAVLPEQLKDALPNTFKEILTPRAGGCWAAGRRTAAAAWTRLAMLPGAALGQRRRTRVSADSTVLKRLCRRRACLPAASKPPAT